MKLTKEVIGTWLFTLVPVSAAILKWVYANPYTVGSPTLILLSIFFAFYITGMVVVFAGGLGLALSAKDIGEQTRPIRQAMLSAVMIATLAATGLIALVYVLFWPSR